MKIVYSMILIFALSAEANFSPQMNRPYYPTTTTVVNVNVIRVQPSFVGGLHGQAGSCGGMIGGCGGYRYAMPTYGGCGMGMGCYPSYGYGQGYGQGYGFRSCGHRHGRGNRCGHRGRCCGRKRPFAFGFAFGFPGFNFGFNFARF